MHRLLVAAAMTVLSSYGAGIAQGQPAASPPATNRIAPAASAGNGNPADRVQPVAKGARLPEFMRPDKGYEHADLDRAWAGYAASVQTARNLISDALRKKLDSATEKGDLDAAEKTIEGQRAFEAEGLMPTDLELAKSVTAAKAAIVTANEQLEKDYAALVKTLTQQRRLAEARRVRNEADALQLTTSAERGPAEGRSHSGEEGLAARTTSQSAGLKEIVIECLIDGESELCVSPSGLWWRSGHVAKPGRHEGKNEPTFVNGRPWFPQWGQPNQDRGADVTALLPLSVGDLNLDYEVLAIGKHRGDRGLPSRSPLSARRDGNALIVTIPDREFGSMWYTIRLFRAPQR